MFPPLGSAVGYLPNHSKDRSFWQFDAGQPLRLRPLPSESYRSSLSLNHWSAFTNPGPKVLSSCPPPAMTSSL